MRNLIIRLLFLPIAMLLWIIGWIMLSTGSHKQRQTQQTPAEDGLACVRMNPLEADEGFGPLQRPIEPECTQKKRA